MPPLPYTYEELLGATVAETLAADGFAPTSNCHVTVHSALSGRPLPPLALCSAADARQAVTHGREAGGLWSAAGAAARLAAVTRLRKDVCAGRAVFLRVLRHCAGLGAADAAEEWRETERLLRHAPKGFVPAMRWWRRAPYRAYAGEHADVVPSVTVSYGDDARPLASLFEGALPTLLNGGAVITEVSARSAPVALVAAAMARGAGLPPRVWQVAVRGEATNGLSGSALRAVLAEHADAVAPLCCPPDTSGAGRARPRPPSLLVLRHDGSARAAARGAVQACFARAGRGCAATPLVAVHASRATDFLENFRREAAAFTYTTALPDDHHLARLTDWTNTYVAAGVRSLLPDRHAAGRLPGVALPVPAPVLLVDPAALNDSRPEIPLGPIALVTRFTHWAEVLDHARHSGHHLGIFTRTQLSQLAPQFAALPARSIHLNQPPRAGLLP